MSAGACTHASSASKPSASTLAAPEALESAATPANGAMILAQLMIDLPVQAFQTVKAFPQATGGSSLILSNDGPVQTG